MTVENPQALKAERKKTITDAVRQNPDAKRIPLMSSFGAWPIHPAGYKLTEALSNYDLLDQIMGDFHEKYNFDMYQGYFSRYYYRVTHVMGDGGLLFDDELGSVYYLDETLLHPEEYDFLIENGLAKTTYEKMFPRKFPFYSREDAIEKIKAALVEQRDLNAANAKRTKLFLEHYGVPSRSGLSQNSAIDDFYPQTGMKNFGIQLRRLPESKIMDIIQAFDNGRKERILSGIENYVDSDDFIYAYSLTSISSSMLSINQFGKYAWDLYWKPNADKIVEKDLLGNFFPEGSYLHLRDFFRDLPAGHFSILTEQDDPFEVAKILPNITIEGGFPTTTLGKGTKEQVVDKVKELIDKLGKKLILSPDKMLVYPSDCNPANLDVMLETAREYGKY